MLSAPGIVCEQPAGHDGYHSCLVVWSPQLEDHAPTLRIPPVRESIGPRRRPPAPMVAELSERVDLLRALVDELAGYDDDQADATPCGVCGHPRFSHSDDGRYCGHASCPCTGFLVPLVAP